MTLGSVMQLQRLPDHRAISKGDEDILAQNSHVVHRRLDPARYRVALARRRRGNPPDTSAPPRFESPPSEPSEDEDPPSPSAHLGKFSGGVKGNFRFDGGRENQRFHAQENLGERTLWGLVVAL